MDDPDALGRKAMQAWLSERIAKDLPTAPRMLWHYTDAAGLNGILTSDRLWATQARFLNDSKEIAYGAELATRVLARHNRVGLKRDTVQFIRDMGNPERRIIEDFFDKTLDVFVTCFCSKRDLLSQWRAYAGHDSVGGYALGFRPPRNPQVWAQSAPGNHGLALRRVLYDEAEQELVCRGLIRRLVEILNEDPADVARQAAFARHLLDGIVELTTWCKHPAFAEEQEWRLIYLRNNDRDPLPLKHRAGRGLVIPYVELEVPKRAGRNAAHLPLAEIDCGPSTAPELKQQGVRSLLNSMSHFATVKVGGSLAPLRL
jgi:hypothetical protein